MNFNNPIPRASQPLIHEGSGMRSVRDTDAVSQSWRKINQANQQDFANSEWARRIQSKINQLRRRILGMPQAAPLAFTNYYSFKIYQPSGPVYVSSTATQYGTIFDDSGNPSSIVIDPTMPTSLPTTVNPQTDAWRFVNIRSGYIYARPYYSSVVSPGYNDQAQSNYSVATIAEIGTDWIEPQYAAGHPFDYQTDISQADNSSAFFPIFSGSPFVMDGAVDSNGQFFYFIYLVYTPDSAANPGVGTAQVQGRRVSNAGGGFDLALMPHYSPYYIPIGLVTVLSAGSVVQIDQIQFGPVALQYGCGMYDFTNPGAPAAADTILASSVYRGNWLTDAITNQVFYPGDYVRIDTSLAFGGSVGTKTNRQLWMQTAVGFTSNPAADADWIQIGGL